MSESKERVVIRYSDGTEAQVGDTVLIDETERGLCVRLLTRRRR